MKELVTKDSLQAMLDIDKWGSDYVEKVVGKALVALLKRQTAAEASQNVTGVDNGVGFSGADAHSGCISAKYFLKWKSLGYAHGDHWRLEAWTKINGNGYSRICKYVKQLNEVANEKNP